MSKKKKTKEHSGQDLRNLAIMSAAASGKTQSEVADEFDISREQVNRILNSDEAKRLTDQARGHLQSIASEAVETLYEAMLERKKNMGVAVHAAISILKGLSVLSEKVKVESELKPFVLRFPSSGEEIHLGHKPEKEGENA